MAGDNMTWKLPTEVLKTELDKAKAEIQRLRAELIARKEAACPDLRCENCRQVNYWLAEHGDVRWMVCQRCQAGVNEPCRWAGRGTRGKVLRRPHAGRPWREPADDDLV